jgi:transcriptional regulator with XRE-family HTH domain
VIIVEGTIDLGYNLKEGLFRSRKSARQLAKTLGVHEGTLLNWLNNRTQPDALFLWEIANLLDQDIRSFYDPEKYPFKRKPKVGFRQRRRGASSHTDELGCLVG